MDTLKIPSEKFTGCVESKFLYTVIERAIEKYGGSAKLADELRKWQRKKRNIPLDCLFSITNSLSLAKQDVGNHIEEIRLQGGRKGMQLSYPILLSSQWAFASECIRVEGTLLKNSAILDNTNTEITSLFKRSIIHLGIPPNNISESLSVRVQVPNTVSWRDVRIINESTKSEIKNFHLRTLPLKKGQKKEAMIYIKDFSYSSPFTLKVICPSSTFKITISIPNQGKIECMSTLKDSRYQKAAASVRIQVHNKTFSWILNSIFEIPIGNKSKVIRIPRIIKNAKKSVIANAVNAVLACESTVVTTSRRVTVASLSTGYISDFKELLERFSITSTSNDSTLHVCGERNFRKMKTFDFVIKKKRTAFNNLLKTRMIQAPKGASPTLYLLSMNHLGAATWKEIVTHAQRSGNSSRLYLKKMLDNNLVSTVGASHPKRYVITPKGKAYMERRRMYWD